MQNQYVLRDIASPHLRAPAQETSDEALIGLIADGDKRAMQVLYARHNVRVYRFILRLTSNQSLAEDLVSEVFLDVWRQAEAFESKSQVSTWLLAIARYKALSALRRRTFASGLESCFANSAGLERASTPSIDAVCAWDTLVKDRRTGIKTKKKTDLILEVIAVSFSAGEQC